VKGVIFNLLEHVVRADDGHAAWDDVVERSGVSGAYTSLGSYPDSDYVAIATTVAQLEGTDVASVVRRVGQRSIAELAAHYPEFFTPHTEVRSFLLTLNAIIHPEVRKLYPGAVVPEFGYRSDGDQVLDLIYTSPRQRCDLAEGLILGAIEFYGHPVELTQPECMTRGDTACVLRVRAL
jgi:hypothetical protein